jgi:hypothetical protein
VLDVLYPVSAYLQQPGQVRLADPGTLGPAPSQADSEVVSCTRCAVALDLGGGHWIPARLH